MMNALQTANVVIEKLQEENRIALEALRQSENNVKYLEREVTKKDHLIKILEEKIRTGSNCYLETINRERTITIKHLELQVQSLLRENKDFLNQINSSKTDSCVRCEGKSLLNVVVKKSNVKSATKNTNLKTQNQKPSRCSCENSEKLIHIIEHKDKRISHLSKQVQKLAASEKELTNKVYRLTRLLSLSHMSPEVLLDCLLQEIQSLESQLHPNKDNLVNDITNLQVKGFSLSPSKGLSSLTQKNRKRPVYTLEEKNESSQKENAMMSNLKKLYNDVSELKKFFAIENDKLFHNMAKNYLQSDVLKTLWNDVISRINEISESIKNIIIDDPKIKSEDSLYVAEKELVILRLQDRLKEALELSTQYEEENSKMKENIESLKRQLIQVQGDLLANTKEDIINTCKSDDTVQHFQELLNTKQKQLEASERHLVTCQNFIEELQKQPRVSQLLGTFPDEHTATTIQSNNTSSKKLTSNRSSDTPILNSVTSSLQKKLQVAERSIRTCEDVIECLQKKSKDLEEENCTLKYENHSLKSHNSNRKDLNELQSLLKVKENELISAHSLKKNLEKEYKSIESENTNLKIHLNSLKKKLSLIESLESVNSTLKDKLQAAEESLTLLQNQIAEYQIAIDGLKEDNKNLRSELQSVERNKTFAETYKEDVISMKDQLNLKEVEIQSLKESIGSFKRKAYEMNHYRKTLKKDIEKLCNTLQENSDSSTSRDAIYKAAVLHTALLKLDEDTPLEAESNEENALEELKLQVSVYLTEVARINELLTIKEQGREELLRQYLDFDTQGEYLGESSDHDTANVELLPVHTEVSLEESRINTAPGTSNEIKSGSESVQEINKQIAQGFKIRSDDVTVDETITTYLLSRCAQLEHDLEKREDDMAARLREIDDLTKTIQNLNCKLNEKNQLAQQLNTLIEMMHSKECNDEITMSQLKSQLQFLEDAKQKMFETVSSTQTELCKYKTEKSLIQNDLNNLQRELINEKYEHAKVNNELKQLHSQLNELQSVVNREKQ